MGQLHGALGTSRFLLWLRAASESVVGRCIDATGRDYSPLVASARRAETAA